MPNASISATLTNVLRSIVFTAPVDVAVMVSKTSKSRVLADAIEPDQPRKPINIGFDIPELQVVPYYYYYYYYYNKSLNNNNNREGYGQKGRPPRKRQTQNSRFEG
jgi:hypothetical protein